MRISRWRKEKVLNEESICSNVVQKELFSFYQRAFRRTTCAEYNEWNTLLLDL